MTDLGSFVSRAHAPFHSGSGDQYILIPEMAEASQRLGTHGQDPRTVAEQQLAFVHQRFVPPRHLGEARRLLHEYRTVVISGAPGSGRHTAAQMLLYERGAAGTGIHEVDPEDGEGGGVTLDRQAVVDGDRLLLDLSACEATRFVAVRSELSAFRSTVEERGARLVVVLHPGLDVFLTAELQRLTVHIDRPHADHVLMRYLRRAHLTPPPTALAAPALSRFLDAAPMRDVARLAQGIRRARDVAPADSFGAWWPGPLAQLTEDDPEAVTFARELAGGRQRALALTVAMLHGSAPDTVYHAVTALLELADHPQDERPRLDRADLTKELDALGCGADQAGRVRFTEPGRVRAVLTHFWSYFPDLRPEFRTWVAHCVRKLGLDREERDQLIRHFAEQALRTGHPEELLSLAREWTAGGLMPDAAKVLEAGLLHDVHGRAVRHQILADVRQRGQPRTYRLALTVVCSQVMAVGHPDQALVRLHHLARAEDAHEGRPALTALLALATSEPRLCGLLLFRLITYGIGPTGFRAPSEARIFLALADAAAPRPALYADPSARRRLTECWATVFAYGPHEEWMPHVGTWLDAALTAGVHRDVLLATLAAAAAPYPAAAGRTYVISQQWVPAARGTDRTQRRDVAEHYRRRLDAAQGIGPPPDENPPAANSSAGNPQAADPDDIPPEASR